MPFLGSSLLTIVTPQKSLVLSCSRMFGSRFDINSCNLYLELQNLSTPLPPIPNLPCTNGILILLSLIKDKKVSGIRFGVCPSPLSIIEKLGLVLLPVATNKIFSERAVLCCSFILDNFPL